MEFFDKLLQYAVSKEDEAASFYEFLAAQSKRSNIRQVFLDLAAQEKAHRASFAKIVREGCRLKAGHDAAKTSARLSEYLVDVPYDPQMTYQDALILAMKREEKSMGLYRGLAERVDDPCLAETMERLAREEEAHKARLEALYDRDVLTED